MYKRKVKQPIEGICNKTPTHFHLIFCQFNTSIKLNTRPNSIELKLGSVFISIEANEGALQPGKGLEAFFHGHNRVESWLVKLLRAFLRVLLGKRRYEPFNVLLRSEIPSRASLTFNGAYFSSFHVKNAQIIFNYHYRLPLSRAIAS